MEYAGTGQIGASNLGVEWDKFERDDASVCRKSAGKPDGAVAAKSSDLQNATRPGDADKELKELALKSGDVDRRKTRLLVRNQG